jgi:cell division protein FtsB
MKRRNRIKWRILVLCVFFAGISLPRIKNLIKQQRQFQKYQAEIAQLEKENHLLMERIGELKGDPYYTEKLLRENYGYVREGEYIYRIKR